MKEFSISAGVGFGCGASAAFIAAAGLTAAADLSAAAGLTAVVGVGVACTTIVGVAFTTAVDAACREGNSPVLGVLGTFSGFLFGVAVGTTSAESIAPVLVAETVITLQGECSDTNVLDLRKDCLLPKFP